MRFPRLPAIQRRLPTLLDRALTVALVLGLALPIWRFVSRLPARLSYPFELEWMEGGIISHIHVVLAGEPLYVAPSLHFTPFIYTPFYYYVCAAVSKVVGEGYFAARLVSSTAILGCFVLLFWWVWRETRSALAGFVAAGLFAATYHLSGRWFDIARADSLLVLLLLGGCVCGRLGRSVKAQCATGVLLALAFFTKQSALSFALPVLLAAFARSPRKGWLPAACFVGLSLLGIGLLQLSSHGWFYFYVFELPAHHEVNWAVWREALMPFWSSLAPMVLSGIAVLFGLPLLSDGPRSWFASGLLVVCAAAGSVASLLHTGGYSNVLMPAFAALAFASSLVVARARGEAAPSRLRYRLLASAVVLLQLCLLSFGETPALPPRGDAEVGQQIIDGMARLPGPLWCTTSNYYPMLAGHPETFTHAVALVDVFKGTSSKFQNDLLASIDRELRSGSIRTIVADRAYGFLPLNVVALIHANYRRLGHLVPGREAAEVWPNTGAGVRPDEVWTHASSPQ